MVTQRDIAWWYWLVTVALLGTGLFISPTGLYAAMALCVVQAVHILAITRNAAAFPLQVRVAYLALLIAGLWEPLQWIHWMQLIGTTARVLIGYCLLARTLSLAPWNRWHPLTVGLIRRTVLSRQSAVSPCGAAFHRMGLERVHG